MTEEVICTSCKRFVKYGVRNVDDYISLCDHTGKVHIVSYTRKYAYCIHCGKEVYVSEIENYNSEEPIKQWHKQKGETK